MHGGPLRSLAAGCALCRCRCAATPSALAVALLPQTEEARQLGAWVRRQEGKARARSWRQHEEQLREVRDSTPARIDSYHG